MFHEDQKGKEQHGMKPCDFECSTHGGLNRKREQKCIEKENQVNLAPSLIDNCCNIIYNNRHISSKLPCWWYEWTNSVTPERTHTWNWTDGCHLGVAAPPLSDRRQLDICSFIPSSPMWNIYRESPCRRFFGDWPGTNVVWSPLQTVVRPGGCLGVLVPSLFLEVTESALWSTCPPHVTYARHPQLSWPS